MYDFNDVLVNLDYSISLKTLKTWCIKIEKKTDTKFDRKYARNKAGRQYSYKVFNSKQIELFKRLVFLRSENVPLDKAILDVFMSRDGKKQQEKIYLSKAEFEENKSDTKKLIELTKKTLQDNADLKKRILHLEGLVSNRN